MKILFVCKHNRFRSKIAEGYFKKINKNKNISVASAGVFEDIDSAQTVVDVAKKLGFTIKRKSRGLNRLEIAKQDLVVIVANDVPKKIFDKMAKKVEVWETRDTSQKDEKDIEIISKGIMKKVDGLVKKLEKAK